MSKGPSKRLCSSFGLSAAAAFAGKLRHNHHQRGNDDDHRRDSGDGRIDLVKVFPELANVRISHTYSGMVAYTFDELMHVDQHEGVHYAMGYCGAGVGTSSYCGMRIGQQVLGLAEGRTAFDGLA